MVIKNSSVLKILLFSTALFCIASCHRFATTEARLSNACTGAFSNDGTVFKSIEEGVKYTSGWIKRQKDEAEATGIDIESVVSAAAQGINGKVCMTIFEEFPTQSHIEKINKIEDGKYDCDSPLSTFMRIEKIKNYETERYAVSVILVCKGFLCGSEEIFFVQCGEKAECKFLERKLCVIE